MAEKLSLVPRQNIYKRGVLEVVGNARKMVRHENIVAIAVAAVDAEGFTHSMYEGGENLSTLIGAIERVKFRVLKHQDDS